MKMTLDMTFEDGKKVLDALRDCAIDNGWAEDGLEESKIMEEYTSAVDAALTAMGISVNISHEPDEDENKYCDSAADCYFCNSEDEEDEEEEEEEEDTCQYTLTPMGEFVARALDAGIAFEDAVNLAKIVFDNDEGE